MSTTNRDLPQRWDNHSGDDDEDLPPPSVPPPSVIAKTTVPRNNTKNHYHHRRDTTKVLPPPTEEPPPTEMPTTAVFLATAATTATTMTTTTTELEPPPSTLSISGVDRQLHDSATEQLERFKSSRSNSASPTRRKGHRNGGSDGTAHGTTAEIGNGTKNDGLVKEKAGKAGTAGEQEEKRKGAKEKHAPSTEHPTVAELQNDLGKFYVGGRIYGLVKGFDAIWGKGFKTPAEVRATLPEGKQVVAFQNRNPVHKAHFELLVNAKEDIPNSIVFVHPTCGPTQPGDIDGATRIKTYEVLQDDPFYQKWAEDRFRWSYLPYSMKMAGPREAIQHMIIRKNFGATHFIIGRDMAGTKSTVTGDDFYGPFDAQEIGEKYGPELAMKVAKYPNMVYVGEENGNARGFATEQDAKDKGLSISKLSGTKFRDALRNGEDVPDWFAFPAVVKTLQEGGDKIFIPGR